MSDFISSLVDGLSNASGIGSAIGGGLNALGNIGSTILKSNAQNNAINTLQNNAKAGEGFIDSGVGNYASTISPLLTEQPITLPTYRDLTTQQQLGESDLQRQNQAALAASGLRGAGRAGISSLEDSNARYEAGARAGNDATMLQAQQQAQNVQNQARTGLANVQAAAGTAKANTAIGAGTQVAGLQNSLGSTLGQGLGAVTNNLGTTANTILAAGTSPSTPTTVPNATSSPAASVLQTQQVLGSDPNSGGYGLAAGNLGVQPQVGPGGKIGGGV